MSYLERIATCRAWRPERYRPFVIGDEPLGRVTHHFAQRLADFPRVFRVSDRAVVLAPELTDVGSRTAAVDPVLRRLAEAGEIRGWREEPYPITPRWGQAPRMAMERAAVPLFGCRAYGVHLNGLVADEESTSLWVAKRARTKETAPGKLDHLVAGGQPQGIGVRDNLIKECAEEAAVPRALAEQAVPVGVVSYRCERPEGLRDDVLFCYDLALPADFAPRNTDGEVAWFQLWPLAQVLARLRDTDDFKFNCALVILDLAIRRGHLSAQDPDYTAIAHGLRLPA
jgi:isopentenyldiphosphate isomerase